jgi:methionyl-tRNA formyltransferase
MRSDAPGVADASRVPVLLLGLGPTALSALEALHERFQVVGLVREATGADDDAAARAHSLGIPVHTDASLRAVSTLVQELRPACVVVSSYNRILPAALLEACPFVNVHYAPLPRLRGRASVNWALINGEPCTAITIHTLVPGLDAGGILYQRLVPISDTATVTDLYEQLNALQREALAGAVQRRLDGDEGVPQDEADATYGCTRLPEDGEIDWSAPTAVIDRLVRALTEPYPGAYTYLGTERLWVARAVPLADPPRYEGRVPGRVVNLSRAHGFVDVLTGDGVLRLLEVRPDNGTPAPASELITSVRTTLGLRTADLLTRLGELERQLAELRALINPRSG